MSVPSQLDIGSTGLVDRWCSSLALNQRRVVACGIVSYARAAWP
jgi:hypothetical protein